jgi:hypothetical protein
VADRTLAQKVEDGLDHIGREEIENRIRLIAYGIWEEEGKPDGRERAHWHEAERRAHVSDNKAGNDNKSRAPRTRRSPVKSKAKAG